MKTQDISIARWYRQAAQALADRKLPHEVVIAAEADTVIEEHPLTLRRTSSAQAQRQHCQSPARKVA